MGFRQNVQNILAQVDLISPKWITCFRQTALENKPWIVQIFNSQKFQNHQTTGLEAMAKKLTYYWPKANFSAMTFESMVKRCWNFEGVKICVIDDLFAKAVCRSKVVNLG